jgi:hypothetical protein
MQCLMLTPWFLSPASACFYIHLTFSLLKRYIFLRYLFLMQIILSLSSRPQCSLCFILILHLIMQINRNCERAIGVRSPAEAEGFFL